jgi:16S rRNA (cytosine967-C5)-methyltransferase
MRLLLASTNAHKLVELRELCAGLSVGLAAATDLPEVVEDADTFLGNALKKAASAARATGETCLADDSGLCVAALDGAPGVWSARFSGPGATDASNRQLLLERMAGATDRRAWFRCVLVVCGPHAEGPGCGRTDDGLAWRAFEGRTDGRILEAERGEGGFGYDALFHHDALGLTFAEATPAQKHAVSHRGQAFLQLRTWLAARLLAGDLERNLYLRATGVQALADAWRRAIDQRLRHADQALEQALGLYPNLGGKERAAVAHLFFHGLRRAGVLQLAVMATYGQAAPDQSPDPRTLRPSDAALLACLTLADVDPMGLLRDPRRGGTSALAALVGRAPNWRPPLSPHDADKALRAAGHVLATLPEAPALLAGVTADFLAALGQQWQAASVACALDYLSHQGPLTVRANRLLTTREDLEIGVPTVPLAKAPDALVCLESARLTKLLAFHQGAFEVQDEGSQRIVALLDPRPDETVLDWCAGAGGKTLAIAAAMANCGVVWALDNNARRLQECQRRLTRAGVTCARVQAHDRQSPPPLADAVLVDAPCTSTGALRRSPELRWHIDGDWLGRFPAQQAVILAQAARHVRPGGRLVYATCSLMHAENEAVVASFLQAHTDFRLEREERIGPADPDWLALHPLPAVGPDGFYAAKLVRQPATVS